MFMAPSIKMTVKINLLWSGVGNKCATLRPASTGLDNPDPVKADRNVAHAFQTPLRSKLMFT